MPAPLYALLLAPFVGSFLGVLILRLPQGRDVVWARSACDGCGARLSPLDLVPIFSFLALRGRCRRCGAPIGWFALGVELAAVAIAVGVTLSVEPDWVWAGCVLGWALLALGWIDLRHLLLPDVLTLPLVLAGLAWTWWLDPDSVFDHAVGAALGYLVLRAVEIGYRRLRGRDGLGQGDAKLMASAGAWLGWQALPTVLVAAAVVGIAFALVTRKSLIPLGACIAPVLFGVWLLQQARQALLL